MIKYLIALLFSTFTIVSSLSANPSCNPKTHNCFLCDHLYPAHGLIAKSYYGVNDEQYTSKSRSANYIVPPGANIKAIQSILDTATAGSLVVFTAGFYTAPVYNPDYPDTYNPDDVLYINKSLHIAADNHWLVSENNRTRLINIRFSINAPNVVVEGFEFRSGRETSQFASRHQAITVKKDSNNVNIVSNRFLWVGERSNVKDGAGITVEIIDSNNALIEHNRFEKNYGVAIKTDDLSRRIIVRSNHFLNSSEPFLNYKPEAGEILHLGNGNSDSNGNSPISDVTGAIVERNYIENWALESELVSIKSDKNIIKDNLSINTGSAAIVIRMGHNNLVKDNIMIGVSTMPVRISGSRNHISGNFFSADRVGSGYVLALHDQYPIMPDNSCTNFCFDYLAAQENTITSNTYVGFGGSLLLIGADDNQEPPNPKNNLFIKNTVYTANQNAFSNSLENAESNNILSSFDTTGYGGNTCVLVPSFFD